MPAIHTLDDASLDLIFRTAQTHHGFHPESLPDSVFKGIWDLAKWGPTSANTCPLRIAFVRSPEAKEKLRPALFPNNVEKTIAAPVTAIFAYDLEFYELLGKLTPQMADLRDKMAGNPVMAETMARTNATLEAGYFIIAARAAGLDCGPMGGFDAAKVNETFFAGTGWRALFLCNLGHGDPEKLRPRNPRPDFEEACKVL